jgi:hypothetical protein
VLAGRLKATVLPVYAALRAGFGVAALLPVNPEPAMACYDTEA